MALALAVAATVAGGAVATITVADPAAPPAGDPGGPLIEVTGDAATPGARAVADGFADQVRQWCAGTRRHFDVPLAWDGVGAFATDVYVALLAVDYATTVTYGQLAERAGHPGAARAVGRAMATNPWPLVVPCHRVVPASGGIGAYGPGPALKARLLAFESAVAAGQAPS